MTDDEERIRELVDVEYPEEFYGEVVDTQGPVPEAPRHDAVEDSLVNFRNIFSTSWFGNIKETGSYSVEGELPESGKVVFHVHGWRNNERSGKEKIDIMKEAYRDEEHSVTGAIWASDDTWWNAKSLADEVGREFADFLTDYTEEHPDVSVRLQGHSLGARVVAEASHRLYSEGEASGVDEVVLLGGAVKDSEVSREGRYGEAFEEGFERVENFYFEDDAVLKWLGLYERSGFIGNNGCEGDTPDNYTDHSVDVGGHGGYYLDDEMREILSSI